MKVKFCVSILITLAIFPALFSSVSAQRKKIPRVKKPIAEIVIWQNVNWEKWGVAYSLPGDLKLKDELPKNNTSRPDGFFGDMREYEKASSGKSNDSRVEMMLDITNWKGETVRVETEKTKIDLTPEQMFEIDHNADLAHMKDANSPIEEVNYLEIDGLKGTYILANGSFEKAVDKSPTSRIKVIWQTFRIYRGNVQRVMISFSGQRKELATMKKIINSLEFS